MIYETNARTPQEAYGRLRAALAIVSAGIQRDASRNSCWLTGAAVAVHVVEDALATTPKALPATEEGEDGDEGRALVVPPMMKKRSKMGRAMIGFVKLFFGLVWTAACAVGLWWIHTRHGVVLQWWYWWAALPGVVAFMDGALLDEEDQLAERRTLKIISKDATKRKPLKVDTSELTEMVEKLERLSNELKVDATSAAAAEDGEDEDL